MMNPVLKSLMTLLPTRRPVGVSKLTGTTATQSKGTSSKTQSKSLAELPRDMSIGGDTVEMGKKAPTESLQVSPQVTLAKEWDILVSFMSKAGKIPQNPNKVNQDRSWVHDHLNEQRTYKFFGVADGHGVHGHDVSEVIMKELPVFLAQQLLKSSPKTALMQAYAKMTADIEESELDATFSGSTCVSVLAVGKRLLCANVGDSRAILGTLKSGSWTATALSVDHKPDIPAEKKRILAKRGRVATYQSASGEPIGPARVWLKNQELPGLAMSRSFGDSVAAQVGVISEPEITETSLTNDDKIMVIASDGVWEFLENEAVIGIVSPYYALRDTKSAAELLCQKATQKWRQEEECVDDITAIVCFFY